MVFYHCNCHDYHANHLSFFFLFFDFVLNLTIFVGKFKPVIKKAMVELEGTMAIPSLFFLHCCTILLMPLAALVLNMEQC